MAASASPTVPSASVPTPSFWEDLIDIFFQPAQVFRRRQNASVWPPLLFVSLSIGLIFLVTFNTLQPLFDAEFNRGAAKAIAANPQVTQDVMNRYRDISETVTRYGISAIMFGTMLILGTVAWLVGRFVGSKQTFHAAIVVTAWSYMPRVIGAVLGGVQGLVMDPEKLKSQMSISLSPARFLDPDASNQLLFYSLGRLDLITIWVTVLLGIGLFVTGKVSKQQSTVFAILMWILGSLPSIRAGFLAS